VESGLAPPRGASGRQQAEVFLPMATKTYRW